MEFILNGSKYFVKIHRGVGWKEIVKNLLQLKTPVVSAKNEYQAIQRLNRLGIDTLVLVGYGIRGKNPATLFSFVITKEHTHTHSLETYCRQWKDDPPPFGVKARLITQIALMSRRMHKNGINHRDYYLCHFLINAAPKQHDANLEDLRPTLIDLHRAQIRGKTPLRWIIKDMSGIYFSAMEIGLSQRDKFRFMMTYSNKSLRDLVRSEQRFWRRVEIRAIKLYRKVNGIDPHVRRICD